MSREQRRLFQEEESTAEPGHYGCPMLVRNRFEQMGGRPIPVMRCSLGWALHNDLDAARCRATEIVTDCWMLHPEQAPLVVLSGTEPGVSGELQTRPVEVAGD